MRTPIDVETGAVKTAVGSGVIKSSGIGSCVAVVAYDSLQRIGGIAHVMFPGCCPDDNHPYPFRYCGDALDELFARLGELGVVSSDLIFCLAGGANVLQRENCTIGRENIRAVREYLIERNISVRSESLGGYIWRSVRLDLGNGEIFCREAGENTRMLWPVERSERIRRFGSYKSESEVATAING
jgi:chemotaxis protein CheD